MTFFLRKSLPSLAFLLCVAPTVAFGQGEADKATARQLGLQGEQALAASQWQQAEDDFRRAESLFHAPTLTLGLARAQAHGGKFVEAWENYHRIIVENVTTPPAFAKALADASTEIASVEGRRSRLTIQVTGADAPKVMIDNAPVNSASLGIERFTDPGHHVIVASADGYTTVTKELDLAEGKADSVSIALEKGAPGPAAVAGGPGAPAAAPGDAATSSGWPLQKTLGVAAMGVGGAGLITGIITGILALSDHSTLKSDCPTGTCTTSAGQSELSSYHTVGAVSTAGWIIGGVAAAGGVVLFVTAPKGGAPKTGMSPYVGPGSIGVVGKF